MIYAISGLAGSGKDTIADYLLLKSNLSAKVSLADPIKRICKDIFDFSDLQLWGPSAERGRLDYRYPRDHTIENGLCACCGVPEDDRLDKTCHLTPRYALQRLGTELGRDCYSDIWINYALRVANTLLNDVNTTYSPQTGIIYGKKHIISNIIIPDIRFINEINAMRYRDDTFCVRVKRSGAGLSGSAKFHASERGQMRIPDSSFDAIINNNDTLKDLYLKVDEIFVK